jgi:hypothetical protein
MLLVEFRFLLPPFIQLRGRVSPELRQLPLSTNFRLLVFSEVRDIWRLSGRPAARANGHLVRRRSEARRRARANPTTCGREKEGGARGHPPSRDGPSARTPEEEVPRWAKGPGPGHGTPATVMAASAALATGSDANAATDKARAKRRAMRHSAGHGSPARAPSRVGLGRRPRPPPRRFIRQGCFQEVTTSGSSPLRTLLTRGARVRTHLRPVQASGMVGWLWSGS